MNDFNHRNRPNQKCIQNILQVCNQETTPWKRHHSYAPKDKPAKRMTRVKDSVTSKLLIWPRRRPRDDPGWVLGWITTEKQRNIVVCAGILPFTKSVHEYRKTIQRLKETQPSDPLTESLDIVACFCGFSKQDPVLSDSSSKKLMYQLPKIRLRQGYPWWDEEDCPATYLQHKQVLYYHQNGNKKGRYEHFASEYGGKIWPTSLYQLNHAQEILQIVQSGRLTELTTTTTQQLEFQTNDTGKSDDNPKPEQSSRLLFLDRLTRFFVGQSMTLLHFKLLISDQRNANFLSCISWLRCFQNIPIHKGSSTLPFQRPSVVSSRPKAAKQYVAQWDRFLSAVIDTILGVLIAGLLFLMLQDNAMGSRYYLNIKEASLTSLKQKIGWLEGFPAGFKLNVQLTHNMGHEIRNLIQVQKKVLSATFWNPELFTTGFVPFLAALAGLCGFTSFLAILVDLFRLEIVFIMLLHYCFRTLYKAELYLLSALWRLFRGKKRNALRQRTDSMQYDAMQLLVGTIAFCICIFLWTTILVYYTFFVAVNVLFHLPVLLVWFTYASSRAMPWGTLLWRTKKPQWFSKTTHLQILKDDGDVLVTRLCSNAESHGTLLGSSLFVHFKPLFQWWIGFCSELLFPRNTNPLACTMPLAMLMNGFVPPPDEKKI